VPSWRAACPYIPPIRPPWGCARTSTVQGTWRRPGRRRAAGPSGNKRPSPAHHQGRLADLRRRCQSGVVTRSLTRAPYQEVRPCCILAPIVTFRYVCYAPLPDRRFNVRPGGSAYPSRAVRGKAPPMTRPCGPERPDLLFHPEAGVFAVTARRPGRSRLAGRRADGPRLPRPPLNSSTLCIRFGIRSPVRGGSGARARAGRRWCRPALGTGLPQLPTAGGGDHSAAARSQLQPLVEPQPSQT
jgi:hypothetical protein